ncbi:hypothetical protein N0V90_001707 [Kalmusia sp. IMI 367209]|nr:hypothetical protein N0V90_001707 [Kalmusia sp. IMI 367209]
MTAYLSPILQWGRDNRLSGMSTHILKNALRLAKGRLRMIIVLFEPIADSCSYDEMIQRCATLQEINSLIRMVSHGRYSLDDVTILDARILLSKARRERWNIGNDIVEAAYNVFQDVVEQKSPIVILTLQCQTRTAKNRLARKLCGHLQEQPATGRLRIRGHNTVIIYGFHPSMYLNHTEDSKEQGRLRRFLTTRFQKAFDCLEAVQARRRNTARNLGQTYRNQELSYSQCLNRPHSDKYSLSCIPNE